MARETFLCIDAGTSRFKAALIAIDGTITAQSDKAYAPFKKVHEYSTEDFTGALADVVSGLGDTLRRMHVSAIGVTGHGPTLIPIDEKGSSLFPAVGYLDDRVKKYIQKLSDKKSDRISTTMYIPIALFFMEEYPDIYNRTYKFLQSFDFITYRLTGEPIASSSTAGITLWDEKRLVRAGLDIRKFPDIRHMGEMIGKTTNGAARDFKIPAHVPVFAVGADFAAGLIGTSALDTGYSCERAGSSGGINICWDAPVSDTRLLCYKHFIKNRYNIAGITSTYGKAVEWARSISGVESTERIMRKPPPSLLFLPYLKGERTPLWNPFATGVLSGVDTGSSQNDVLCAVYTGIGFSIRDAIEIIEENGCMFQHPIVTTGGLAADDWFTQIKSDITGKAFAVTQTHDAELLGTSIVTAQAAGFYPDIRKAAKKIVQIHRVFEPRNEMHARYSHLFRLYRSLRDRIVEEGLWRPKGIDNTGILL
jgi:xylulokinase